MDIGIDTGIQITKCNYNILKYHSENWNLSCYEVPRKTVEQWKKLKMDISELTRIDILLKCRIRTDKFFPATLIF